MFIIYKKQGNQNVNAYSTEEYMEKHVGIEFCMT